MIWKVNFGLWAVTLAGLCNKRVLANYEHLLRPIFSLFWKKKFSEKPFFLGLKLEWNLSVNTERSGTDYCWLYCGRNHGEMYAKFGKKKDWHSQLIGSWTLLLWQQWCQSGPCLLYTTPFSNNWVRTFSISELQYRSTDHLLNT